jgi:hypothetical protein
VRITLCSLHGILSASIGQWIGFSLNDADDADGLWKFVGEATFDYLLVGRGHLPSLRFWTSVVVIMLSPALQRPPVLFHTPVTSPRYHPIPKQTQHECR